MPKRTSSSVGFGFSSKQAMRTGDHARCAVATLQAVMLLEHFLQHMQPIRRAKALDGGDLGTIRLSGEHGAGFYRHAVHIHSAGAAMRRAATDMRASNSQFLTQSVDQSMRGSVRRSTSLPLTFSLMCIFSISSSLRRASVRSRSPP